MKKSPLIPIFLVIAVDVLGLTIILPLLPIYAEHMGATPFVASMLVSVYGLCQWLAGPILGQISDRVGRKPVLLVSQFGTFVGFLILAFANKLSLIFLSRIIDGLTAGNIVVAQAYISDVTDSSNRARAFGIVGIAFSIGFLIGPAFSGILAQHGASTPIFVAAGLSFMSILATAFLLPSRKAESAPESEPTTLIHTLKSTVRNYRNSFKKPALATLLWQFVAFTFSFSFFFSGFPLYAERWFYISGRPFGVTEIGYALALMGFMGIVVQGGLMAPLVKKFGETKLVNIGFSCMIVGFITLALSAHLLSLGVALVVLAFGSSILRPSLFSLITQQVQRHEQGITMGLTQSLMSISQIMSPMVGGTIINHRQLWAWAWVPAAVSLVGLSLKKRVSRVSA